MTGAPGLRLRLYLARGAPNSEAALRNLRRALAERSAEVEILDVFQDVARALEDRVVVTPLLIRLAPGPAVRIVGDLNDASLLSGILALEGGR